MKTCSKCKIEKDLSEFTKHKKSKDGFYCQCKPCKKEWKVNNKDKANKKNKQYREKIKDKPKIIIGDKKTCSNCKIKKPFEEFSKDNSKKDKHFSLCKDCAKIHKKQYRKENQDKIKEYTNLYYQDNTEKIRLSIKNSIKNRKNNYPFINSLGMKISKLNKRFKTSFKIIDLLGCSLDDFKSYIESQFQDWINWNTYTFNNKNNDYWYLDFIDNNLNTPHELLHYTNIKIISIITNKPIIKILPKEGFKICCQCKEEKPLSEFFKYKKNKDGLYCKCKVCRPYSKNGKNKKSIPRQPLHKKLKNISRNINRNIRRSFKKKGMVKSKTVCEILGCSYQDFKLYIESKFESWMNWDNYGLYNGQLNHGWDLDHIVPKSIAKTEEDILKLNHYTNFNPLCSKTNRDIKRNKLDF
jgi:hypothetical protein